MDTYCECCDRRFPSDWSHCDECFAVLREFNPAPVRFTIGTGEVAFQSALPNYSQPGFLSRKQAGGM